MSDERPYAVVAITVVYGEVREISGSLAAIGVRLDGMERRVTELETRVDAIDRRRYAFPASALSDARGVSSRCAGIVTSTARRVRVTSSTPG
ncbi:hypothetical protein [Nocardiopsis rhodophaea]|uniref:hypothetical protein n=1 Tax=Nocardiopsis rhodophaea TaxID=280238 RepID=UPI0031E32B6C